MTTEELKIVISAQTKGIDSAVNNTKKSLESLGSSAENSSKKMTSAFSGVAKAVKVIAAAVASVKTIQIGIEGMNQINAATSSINALNRIVGEEATNEIQKWSDEIASKFGLARADALSTAKFMGSILSGFIADSDVAKGTEQLIGQMAIIAAGTGRSMESVQEAIQSGFLGSFEQIENILPTVSRGLANNYAQVYYNAEAFADLNAQQQKYIMYQMIMAESAGMYGTSLTGAQVATNQFKASLADMKTQLGAAFLALVPVVIPVLQTIVNGLSWVLAAIAGVANAIAGLFGKSFGGFKNPIEQVAPAAEAAKGAVIDLDSGLGSASKGAKGTARGLSDAAKSAKDIQKSLMGFDEINKLQEPASASGAGDTGGVGGVSMPSMGGVVTDIGSLNDVTGALQEKFEAFNKKMTEFRDKAEEVFKKIAKGAKDAMPYIAGIGLALLAAFAIASAAEWGSKLIKWDTLFEGAPVAAAIAGEKTGIGFMGKIVNLPTTIQGLFTSGFGAVTLFLQGFAINAAGILSAIPGMSGVGTWLMGLSSGALAVAGAAIIAIIAAIAGAFVDLALHNDEFRAAWQLVWSNIKTTISNVWNTILKPTFEYLGIALGMIWEGGLKPLWEKWVEIWGEISGVITDVLNRVFFPLLNWIITNLGGIIPAVIGTLGFVFTGVFNAIAAVVGYVFGTISTYFASFRIILDGIITFVTGVFAGNWEQAFEGLASILEGVFKGITAPIKKPLNAIIDMVNDVITGLNKMKMPDWVPVMGGKGINIPKIPKLAKGGIVDSATLAVIGEQGKEAVMPLENNTGWIDTLADKVSNRMGGNAGGNDKPIEVVLQMGTLEMGRAVVSSYNALAAKEGKLLFNI